MGRKSSVGGVGVGGGTSKRAVIRLQLDLPAKEALDALCHKRGMTQISVLSRLVKWFAKQDEIVQASVLNLLSETHLGNVSQVLLSRLSQLAPDAGLSNPIPIGAGRKTG